MRTKILIPILAMLLLWIGQALASNVTVSNVELKNVNVSAGTVDVEFDLSQDNTFSGTDENSQDYCDRIWVFVKFWKDGWATDGSQPWGHAILTSGGTVSTYSSSTKTGVASDGMGAFCATGDNQTVRFDVGNTSGVAMSDTIKVRVMAVEMVYVPEGSFYLGDGSSSGCFREVSANNAIQITTTGTVVKCNGTSYDDDQLEGNGILVDGDGGIDEDGTTEISNANFPTGYGAFFVMKYEVSQGQYRDFLNTLTETQAGNRFPNSFNSNRHYITRVDENPYVYYCNLDGDSTYDESTDGEWIACNYLSWEDGCAYADWAGLRPMTELEFEKACRGGGVSAIPGEYAWHSSSGIVDFTALYHSGQADEAPSTDGGTSVNKNCNLNYVNCDPNGPVRCGAFAAADTSRTQAGAAYYGVMEMSGNLYERCVTLGHITGRGFEGTHGNGDPSAINSDWPGSDAIGAGSRGGNWYNAAAHSCVSYRYYAAYPGAVRPDSCGFRCARTP